MALLWVVKACVSLYRPVKSLRIALRPLRVLSIVSSTLDVHQVRVGGLTLLDDANIAIPGCDKNMPGCIMAMARHNRPSIMIYGGTINPGYSKLLKKTINITTCFEAQGSYNYDTLNNPDDPSQTKDDILSDIEKSACPGPGACGGMFTANTMATAVETLGLSLPGSASTPATSPAKQRECIKAAEAIKICMERNIRPLDLLTKRSFENALVMMVRLQSRLANLIRC